MGGACSTHGALRKSYVILTGRPEGKGTLDRRRRRWKYNIRIRS